MGPWLEHPRRFLRTSVPQLRKAVLLRRLAGWSRKVPARSLTLKRRALLSPRQKHLDDCVKTVGRLKFPRKNQRLRRAGQMDHPRLPSNRRFRSTTRKSQSFDRRRTKPRGRIFPRQTNWRRHSAPFRRRSALTRTKLFLVQRPHRAQLSRRPYRARVDREKLNSFL